MISRFPYFLFFVIIFTFGGTFSFVTAQGLGVLPDQIVTTLEPRIPQALEPVELTVTSYNTDLNRARISLYVDGELKSQAIGQKKFIVTSPAVGSIRQIRLVVETIDAGVVEKNITIRPGQVDMLYEALDSYTPIFYPGKKLPAHEGGVRVVAIPYFIDEAGRKLDPKTLVYRWKVGRKNQPDQSGYGRQSFVFEGSPFYRTKDVTVQVESVDGSIVATRKIDIPAYDPVIRFYHKHPLWDMDLSQAFVADTPIKLEVSEMAIEAVPYFFSGIYNDNITNYDWRLNGEPLTTYGDRNVINLVAPESEGGSAVINLRVDNSNQILQIAQSLFTVVFDANSNNSNSSGQDFFGNN